MSLPEHDRSFVSKTQMEENIITLLGGRVSEKIILDDISTGASNDIERATKIARSMVTKYGFSEKLGPVVYGHDETEVLLGRDYSQGRNYSENIAAEIDAEIRELIETSYEKAKDILENHIDQLHILAKYPMMPPKTQSSPNKRKNPNRMFNRKRVIRLKIILITEWILRFSKPNTIFGQMPITDKFGI